MQNDSERQERRRLIKQAVSQQDAAAVLPEVRHLLAASSKPTDVAFCASAFAEIADSHIAQLAATPVKLHIVRSITVEPILPFLKVEAALAGYVLDVKVGGYGSYFDELLHPPGALKDFTPDLVMVLLDLEDLAGRLPDVCASNRAADVAHEIEESISRMATVLKAFRQANPARLLVQGCVLPDRTSLGDVGDANLPSSLRNAVVQLNQQLAALCRSIPACVFFDVDHLAARHGRANWRDERMFLASRLPIASDAFSPYAAGLVRSLSVLFRAPRKVLCTDLDNTLWGGVLGEDGPEGIATGTAFPGNSYLNYQRYLKHLSARGILLAIVSKNDEPDVRRAFEIRAADLALTLDDFVALKISWGDKSEALRELASELSLGLDSFVFVDDNPLETESVRQQLPQVAVIQAPVEAPWKLVDLLSQSPFFDAAIVTDEDTNRLSEYKAQAQRAQLVNNSANRADFLASMQIVCTFESALHAPLSRAVQLLAKTNQFNLTTRRRSASEIEDFASDPSGQAIVVRARDRFGDSGVVGLALARTLGDACHIDSFLLSCRVIGRGIETALLARLAQHAKQTGAKSLTGEFISTGKNTPCATFYPDHGFEPVSPTAESTSVLYHLNLAPSTLATPEWITVEGSQQ
jgi:FkbH-like protein